MPIVKVSVHTVQYYGINMFDKINLTDR